MRYDRTSARQLLPLLRSIGSEIQERTDRLLEIEAVLEVREAADQRTLVAEAAAHRRGLRMAEKELERLGCSVVGRTPLTFRIPVRAGQAKRSVVWRSNDPVLN